MNNSLPSKRRKSGIPPALLRSAILLLLITVGLGFWIYAAICAALAAEYIMAAALGAGAMIFIWALGSIYISLPLAIYFQSKYHSESNYSEIDRVHTRALHLLKMLPFRKSVSIPVTMSNLGLLRLCQGHYENADALFTEAAEYVAKSKRLSQSLSAIVVYNNLAIAKIRLGDYSGAEKVALKALEIAEAPRLQAKYRLFSSPPLAALGNLQMRNKNLESALEYYKKAMDICETSTIPAGFNQGPFDQARVFILLGLAITTIRMGQVEESKKWCDRAWAIIKTNGPNMNTLVLDNLNMLAKEFIDHKLFDYAEPLLELAYTIGQEHPLHPDSKQLLNYYEELLSQTNRQSEVADMRNWIRHIDTKAIASR